jgi:tRNA pseudouridine55 synthase
VIAAARGPSPEGLLLVDKPAGITSHDAVDAVRRQLGTRKVGHAGTLDPMATGLLAMGVGRATRLLRFLGDLSKTYEGTFRLGIETSTLDADGDVVRERAVGVTETDIVAAMAALVGTSTPARLQRRQDRWNEARRRRSARREAPGGRQDHPG